MITRDKALEIVSKQNPGELEHIQVIVRYIYDKTNKDISSSRINFPNHQGQIVLMLHMFSVAKLYYLNNGK